MKIISFSTGNKSAPTCFDITRSQEARSNELARCYHTTAYASLSQSLMSLHTPFTDRVVKRTVSRRSCAVDPEPNAVTESEALLVGAHGRARPPVRLKHSRGILLLLVVMIVVCSISNIWIHQISTMPNRDLAANRKITQENGKITQNAMQDLMDFGGKSPPDVLSRNPKRIPGYVYGSSQTFFGYVFRDLLTRICSRRIAQAHVLVVAPGAAKLAQQVKSASLSLEEEELRVRMNHSVGGSALLHAFRQGHAITGLETTAPFPNLPNWTLLALVDAEYDTDIVLERTDEWLNSSTITYFVLGVGADPEGSMFGRRAAGALFARKYKVQLLSMSHFVSGFRPNILLQEEDMRGPIKDSSSIDSFFKMLSTTANATNTPVRGYLFCTQGLDLAIPAATEYIRRVKPGHIEYRNCGSTNVQLRFVKRGESTQLEATCQGFPTTQVKDVWASDNSNMQRAEAACARIFCEKQWVSACATRIVTPHLQLEPVRPDHRNERPNFLLLMLDPISRARFERSLPKTNRLLQKLKFASFSNYTVVGNNSGPNQAALYSGQKLHSRDMIATHLQEKGSNSTMRQWLWDTLRDEGYATFKAEDGCVANSNMIQSISPQTHHGEPLTRMMCFDFQRPNCVGHKSAAELMVEHFKNFGRKYTIMEHPWAAFLHFIDPHEDTMSMEGTIDTLLWRLLYSFYEHRQIKLMGNTWNNTLILLLSDHGLHYGSYLLSPEGLRERSQPVMHMHLPASASDAMRRDLNANGGFYTTPFDVYQTVLHTLVGKNEETSGLSLLEPLPSRRENCLTTQEIPAEVCSILNATSKPGENVVMPYPPNVLSFYADIPMENKKHQSPCPISTSNDLSRAHSGQCICATNVKEWHNCTMPFNKSVDLLASETFHLADCGGNRSFTIDVKRDSTILGRDAIREGMRRKSTIVRPNILFLELDSVSFAYADRHFPKTRELLEQYRPQKEGRGYNCLDGLCSAEIPFFSVVGANSIPNQASALGGCIVLTGPEQCMSTSKVGMDTLCTDTLSVANGMYLFKTFRFITQTWCRSSIDGMSPWIFDIAKNAGYVTLFAEEFCYDDSKYVTQNNIFPLDVDILPHKLYCREAERKALGKRHEIKGAFWRFENANTDDACIAGPGSTPKVQVSLEHIEKMWDAYPETSKLAYINAMAAHKYSAYHR